MMINEMAIENLLVMEDWELARQVIVEADELEDVRIELEDEFQVDLNSLETIIDLPDASLKDLKKILLSKVRSLVQNRSQDLRRRICVELDYCNNKNSRKAEIAAYLVSALDIVVTGGAAALLALLIKQEYFDKLCQCPK